MESRVLDGNAIGGLLLELFGTELTARAVRLRQLRRARGDGAARRLRRLPGRRRPLPPLHRRDDHDRPRAASARGSTCGGTRGLELG